MATCHSRSKDLAAKTGRADILVAVLGRLRAIPGAALKRDAVVIDVRVNRSPRPSPRFPVASVR